MTGPSQSEALAGEIPDLIPARMLNECAYCPRLFFMEWVEARFEDNDEVAEGRYHHRVVDRPGGVVPPTPEGEEDDPAPGVVSIARSLPLSSERLGITATIDLVEFEDGRARPVDYKRGAPPNVEEGAWEPERVQVCVQGLLLREAGYRCDEGVLYFADARRRVTVPFTPELIERTLELVATARGVATADRAPPPLVDSPKCPRCSLVGLCLPDETNFLLQRRLAAPRRLIARDPPSRPLYVLEQGASVSKSGERLVVTKDRVALDSVRLIDVSQVCVFGGVQVSSQALAALFAREIPTCWFSYGGRFLGIANGLLARHVELRRRQVAIASHGFLPIARRVVASKVRNSRTLLRRNRRRAVNEALGNLATLAAQAERAELVDVLRGLEGAAARTYFGAFNAMLRDDLEIAAPDIFTGRNRRPPRDPVNALLSYVYALLVKDLTVQAQAIGFDPYLGFYHRPRFGRPALALDIAEEFRPLIADSVVISLLNNGEIRGRDFIRRGFGVSLTREGRQKVVRGYERRLDVEVRHPIFGYRVSYRRLLDLQLRILAAHLLGELDDYQGFETR